MSVVKKRVEDAVNALKAGKFIIVKDNDHRENEGDLVIAAQFATSEAINFMLHKARGLICVPMSTQRAKSLDLSPMVYSNEDPHKTAFTVSVDHITSSTGISCDERSKTCMALADPDMHAKSFQRPGHIFPLIAKDGGVLERQGHTEASIDLVRLAGCEPVAVICEILQDNGKMARAEELHHFSVVHDLVMITIEELHQYLLENENARKMMEMHKEEHDVSDFAHLAVTNLPTKFGTFDIAAFHNAQGSEPHLALIKGDLVNTKEVLVRVHSECQTGDIFHSLRCDCGQQLDFALNEMKKVQNAVLIYLRQEGRGIGLTAKLRAYELQNKGLDTVDANLILGYAADARDFTIAADILKSLKVASIRLMTNNPCKTDSLRGCGIEVEQEVKTPQFMNPHNEHYLETKIQKMKHQF